ncbi:MAG: hypothetical protein NTY36_11330 [Deltaproteobacteria bacterium]|nr:hypothetical protein [Deltaproteobacteria bacterium]
MRQGLLSNHRGHFDLAAYDAFLEGKLQDVETDPEEMIKPALANLLKLPGREDSLQPILGGRGTCLFLSKGRPLHPGCSL